MKRSIEITKAQLKSYTNNMLPIVYNTTGVNLHLIKSKIECLRALGYDVGIIHINADLNRSRFISIYPGIPSGWKANLSAACQREYHGFLCI
jgi:hypothetical protein